MSIRPYSFDTWGLRPPITAHDKTRMTVTSKPPPRCPSLRTGRFVLHIYILSLLIWLCALSSEYLGVEAVYAESTAEEENEKTPEMVIAINPTSGYIDLQEAQGDSESIDQVIEDRDAIIYDPTTKSLFPGTFYKYPNWLLKTEQKIGLAVTLSYDALAQGYADSEFETVGAAGDLTLSGRWQLFGSKHDRPFSISFRIRNRHKFSGQTLAEFYSEAGLLWGIVDGFNDAGWEIPNLFFMQELVDHKLTLRYGQYSIDSFVDSHALRGAKRFFLNQLFSDNPTALFPTYGAGFIAHWKDSQGWSLTGGGSNIQETKKGEAVDLSIDSSALFGSLQASYTFKGIADRIAKAQLMGWHNSASSEDELESGEGFSLTLEHAGRNKGDQLVFRYAQADGDATNTDKLFFMAFGKQIKTFNQLGVGVGAGRSADSKDWQSVFEMYCRIQLAKELMITPDLQMIFGESDTNDSKVRFAAGVRIGLTF